VKVLASSRGTDTQGTGGMINRAEVVKWTGVGTAVSLGLGVASNLSPTVAALGWLLGTSISIVFGGLAGRCETGVASAAGAGAVAGGVPILLGTAVGAAMEPCPSRGCWQLLAWG
jgi:hypothetical protein